MRLSELAEIGRAIVGHDTYGDPEVLPYHSEAHIDIGSYCSIAQGVTFLLGGEHNSRRVTTFPVRFKNGLGDAEPRGSKGDINVGNDVWIGYGATILSGVTIGSGAVIGAGAVVAHDVAPYSIVAGNPAQHIRFRFDEPVRRALLRIAWWDWPEDKVLWEADALCSEDVEEFVRRFDG